MLNNTNLWRFINEKSYFLFAYIAELSYFDNSVICGLHSNLTRKNTTVSTEYFFYCLQCAYILNVNLTLGNVNSHYFFVLNLDNIIEL